jgi:hypothetical protein
MNIINKYADENFISEIQNIRDKKIEDQYSIFEYFQNTEINQLDTPQKINFYITLKTIIDTTNKIVHNNKNHQSDLNDQEYNNLSNTYENNLKSIFGEENIQFNSGEEVVDDSGYKITSSEKKKNDRESLQEQGDEFRESLILNISEITVPDVKDIKNEINKNIQNLQKLDKEKIEIIKNVTELQTELAKLGQLEKLPLTPKDKLLEQYESQIKEIENSREKVIEKINKNQLLLLGCNFKNQKGNGILAEIISLKNEIESNLNVWFDHNKTLISNNLYDDKCNFNTFSYKLKKLESLKNQYENINKFIENMQLDNSSTVFNIFKNRIEQNKKEIEQKIEEKFQEFKNSIDEIFKKNLTFFEKRNIQVNNSDPYILLSHLYNEENNNKNEDNRIIVQSILEHMKKFVENIKTIVT